MAGPIGSRRARSGRRRQRARPVRHLCIIRRVVHDNQVEIRGEAHLAAAEPAHRDHCEPAPGNAPVLAGEIGGHRRGQCGEHGLGDVSEGGAGPLAIVAGAQQLHADLKAPLVRPAPQHVERVLVVARRGELRGEIGGEPGAVGQWDSEFGGQHRVEQRRAVGEAFGQRRRLGHDVGDQRQQARVGLEQRKQLHSGRQPRQELLEPQERGIGRRGRTEDAQ